jgi:NifB/MoaA-like Fe-S oxidoreductase
MAQLTVDIGGSPGINCRGFCEYCYFKKVRGVQPLGCRYCLPFKKGCDYCTRGIREEYSGFKDLKTIADETLANLQRKRGELERITISGGGDPSCYPRFTELIELLGSMEAPLHIGAVRAGTIRRLPICSLTTALLKYPLPSLPPIRP